jgi:putative ABC transport system ATP-binding protein
MNILKVDNLYKKYGSGNGVFHALNGVTFEIEAGSINAICGPSGSGKTTLLNLIGLMDQCDSGSIYVNEIDHAKMKETERADKRADAIGFIFQSFNLISVLNAWENTALAFVNSKLSRKAKKQISYDYLEKVGLKGLENRYPSELSGGQQQRVGIARALIKSPQIVLGDEITANLDTETSKDIMNLLTDLARKNSHTFILATHDPLILNYADTVLHIKDGRITDRVVKENS